MFYSRAIDPFLGEEGRREGLDTLVSSQVAGAMMMMIATEMVIAHYNRGNNLHALGSLKLFAGSELNPRVLQPQCETSRYRGMRSPNLQIIGLHF